MSRPAATLLATSLKMYLDHDRTVAWTREVKAIAARSVAVRRGYAELAVFPSFPSLPEVAEILTGVPVTTGGQNMSAEASGPFTGEVSAATLRQVGCTYVEIGHAERRRYFGETEAQTRSKVALAVQHGLVPLLCFGESSRGTAEEAAQHCIDQIASAVASVPEGTHPDMILAYEPEWAIGAQDAADPAYIRQVAAAVNAWAGRRGDLGTVRLIYGGSAKPGLLTALGQEVSGLFLGRFAHDAQAVATILEEVSGRQRLDSTTH